MNHIKLSSLLVFFLFAVPVSAEGNSSKEDFSLFNPTPRDQMRDFSTDRPDKTESAYTVDAGHFQHETDILNYSFDEQRGDSIGSALIMAPNLKVGLTNRTDLQLVLGTFNYVGDKTEGVRSKTSGFGDITARLKVNIWGNDEGATAMALMPYVKFPTNQNELGNNSVEGGLIVPFAIAACEELDIGIMPQVDIAKDEVGDGYHAEYVQSVTFGHGFTEELGGYSELWTSISPERGPLLTADFGLTYAVIEDTQLDIGINIGLTDQSDDLNPFIGISQRF